MKCLVVSYGSIGKRHFEILKNFNQVSEVHIVTSQIVENETVFKSISEACKNNEYYYVVIASPTDRHKNDLEEVAKYNGSAIILIEKPLFEEFKVEIPSFKNQVFIGYNLRYHPVIVSLLDLLKETEEIYYINLYVGQYLPTWRPDKDYRHSYSSKKNEGGGVLLDLSHEIDLLHLISGEIKTFSSLVMKRSSLEISSEDIAIINGMTKNNVIFSMSLDYLSKTPIRKIIIQGKNKTIIADLIHSTLSSMSIDGEVTNFSISKEDRNFTYTQMHTSILSEDYKKLCSFEEGLRINYWIDQMKKNSILPLEEFHE